jgi:hypothetical protein
MTSNFAGLRDAIDIVEFNPMDKIGIESDSPA